MLMSIMNATSIKHSNRHRMYAAMLLVVMLISMATLFLCPGVGLISAKADNIFNNFSPTPEGDLIFQAGTNNDGTEREMDFAAILTKYKTVCTFILSIVTITMIIFLILQFTKLGAAGDNQATRKQAIGGILTTGIATALLGSLTVWFGFFYNAIS